MNTPSPRFSWQAMRDYARSELPSLRDLSADPARCERYEFRFQGLHLDLSKCRIDSELLGLGLGQLDRLDLSGQLRELQAGARLNRSEDRPALHSLVRAESSPHPSLNQAHSEVLE